MKLVKIIFALAILMVILVIGLFYWAFSNLNAPVDHAKADQYVVIERGSSPGQIVDKLAAEGIVANPWLLRMYVRTFGDATKMQAGEYKFASPITPLQVLKELEKGSVQTKRLTIPEGFTRFDIAKRIHETFPQNPPVTEAEILRMMDDTKGIDGVGILNAEGYLFPATYDFPPGTHPQTIIARLIQEFNSVWKPEWTEKARSMGRTPHEIVTIASLIETESPVEPERPVVASVIYNRLAKNIPLGIDQTVVYIAKMQNRWDGTIHKSDIDADSPYNTRKYRGIPPGPISSVSESAIEAALNPAQTDFIFYVRNVQLNDGSHHFYASAADFERGKAEYQRWLEEERKLKRESESESNK